MVDQCKDFETDGCMRVMSLAAVATLAENPTPLTLEERPIPVPGADQVRIRVSTCGVCHTELDEIEGRTPPPNFPVVPGHEVIGRIDAIGGNVTLHSVGDRVGVGWIYDSDGSERENLSGAFRATGRDTDGGYAEYMVVGEQYAYRIPAVFSDEEAAPLLCAGGVGYRALRLCGIQDGQWLGLTGFGGSGHLVLQMARRLYPNGRIGVFARSAAEREFALELGADWAGDTADPPPELMHAIIDTTPVWAPVLAALLALRPGGRLVINAIRKETSDNELLTQLDYARHLWLEKEIKTVANVTSRDLREFLDLAAEIPLRASVETFPLEDANEALCRLKAGHIRGVYVLKINY
jgi:propanol-preferring alcohol dehydrogenase